MSGMFLLPVIYNIKITGNFTIPSKFITYTLDSKLKIKCYKDYEDILKSNIIYYIESELVREITQIVFNYFL